MFVPSARNSVFQAFSTTLVVTLFLCQVIGSFCPMVPPAIMSGTAVHDAGTGCPMEGSSQCMDSIPSAPKVLGNSGTHCLQVADSVPSSFSVRRSAFSVRFASASPADSGPPLCIRLSTFRI